MAGPFRWTGMGEGLVVRVLRALGTPGVDGRGVVQRHRRAVIEETQQIPRTRQDGDLTWTLLVDSLVLRLEAAMRWLDRCEARLAQQAGGPQ